MWTRELPLLALAALLVGLGYLKRDRDRWLEFLEVRGCRYAYERTVRTETAAIHQIVLRCKDNREVVL